MHLCCCNRFLCLLETWCQVDIHKCLVLCHTTQCHSLSVCSLDECLPRHLMWDGQHICVLRAPYTVKQFCAAQAVAQTVWSCMGWFDCLCSSLTIFKQVWILLRNSQVVQQFEACMDVFASCCTTSPFHHWSSYRSHLIFIMSHTTVNKEFWPEFIQS